MTPVSFYFLQQKSVARRKCAGCKISVHIMCMEQLEKVTCSSSLCPLIYATETVFLTASSVCAQINFRCKPSFREPGSRAVREVSVSRRERRLHCCVDPVRLFMCALVLCFSPMWCDITGSTGDARQGSVDSAGR